MKRRPHHEPGCSRCDTPEDLVMIGDAVLCFSCRTCPHGVVYFSAPDRDHACRRCLRVLFTEQTFAGPRIDNIEGFAKTARWYGFSASDLHGNCAADEELIFQLIVKEYEERDAVQTQALITAIENQGTGLANEPGLFASVPAQSGTSPYPLPHHLVRGKTWSEPSGSSSR